MVIIVNNFHIRLLIRSKIMNFLMVFFLYSFKDRKLSFSIYRILDTIFKTLSNFKVFIGN